MRIRLLIVVGLLSLATVLFLVQGLAAGVEAEGGVITVCPAGPPTCDFALIQGGIDAASNGDTVLVSAGTYMGQLQLKNGVVLSGSAGMTDTIVTADNGPIVWAENLTATIHGFTLRGPGEMITATGIWAGDSHLTLEQVAIHSMDGRDFAYNGPGVDANGIYLIGDGSLMAENVRIYDLSAGSADIDTAHWVGSVRGIYANGSWQIAVRRSQFRNLKAGSINSSEFGCEFSPRHYAYGIHVEGDNDLTVEDSDFEGVTSGFCGTEFPQCDAYLYGDDARGIVSWGGRLTVLDSRFHDFAAPNVHFASIGAIWAYGAETLILSDNVVTDLLDLTNITPPYTLACPSYGFSLNGIQIFQAQSAQIENNIIESLVQPDGAGTGYTSGIHTSNSQNVQIFNNRIQNFLGSSLHLLQPCTGCIDDSTIGILVESGSNIDLDANQIGNIQSGDAPTSLYGSPDGGAGSGLFLRSVSPIEVTNNILYAIAGGQGNSYTSTVFGSGGNASGVQWRGSIGLIANNTIYDTIPGLPGDLGQPGSSYGIYIGGGQVTIFNNALVGHKTGMRLGVGASVNNDYQGLWDNDQNYSGILAGPNDVEADPQFVDTAVGNFHLSLGSPFIDRALLNAPNTDFEGENRPLDGDEDGTADFDLGADEFWLGLAGSEKLVNTELAYAGETITYTIHLVNNWNTTTLSGVQLTDTLPAQVAYVNGSLMVSGGSGAIVSDTLSWSGDLAPGASVTIIFAVILDENWIDTYHLVNEAWAADGIGLPRSLRAEVLVNPQQSYMPVFAR